LTTDGNLPCDIAIVVNGDDVTMYGLAAEHTLQDIVQWNGDHLLLSGTVPPRCDANVRRQCAWGIVSETIFGAHSVWSRRLPLLARLRSHRRECHLDALRNRVGLFRAPLCVFG